MPPVKAYQIPDWANPANASVLDNWWTRTARTIGQFMGVNDPESQVMGLAAAPIDVPAADAAGAVKQTLRAYHGSPHDFERFDASKIGTGEGAQAYAYGHYSAQAEPVAAGYKKAGISDPRDPIGNAVKAAYSFSWPNKVTPDVMRDWMVREGVKREHITPDVVDAAIEAVRGQNADGTVNQSALRAYRKIDTLLGPLPKGHMYELNIKVSPDELLDWDKPLGEQPQAIRDKIVPRFQQRMIPTGLESATDQEGGYTGERLYKELVYEHRNRLTGPPSPNPSADAAKTLSRMGIKGVQYFDGASRGAGQGTRNFVIFPGNEHLIDIARKYGVSLPVAAEIYRARQRTQPQPAQTGVE